MLPQKSEWLLQRDVVIDSDSSTWDPPYMNISCDWIKNTAKQNPYVALLWKIFLILYLCWYKELQNVSNAFANDLHFETYHRAKSSCQCQIAGELTEQQQTWMKWHPEVTAARCEVSRLPMSIFVINLNHGFEYAILRRATFSA